MPEDAANRQDAWTWCWPGSSPPSSIHSWPSATDMFVSRAHRDCLGTLLVGLKLVCDSIFQDIYYVIICIYIYVCTHRKKPVFAMYMFMAKHNSKISTCDPLLHLKSESSWPSCMCLDASSLSYLLATPRRDHDPDFGVCHFLPILQQFQHTCIHSKAICYLLLPAFELHKSSIIIYIVVQLLSRV